MSDTRPPRTSARRRAQLGGQGSTIIIDLLLYKQFHWEEKQTDCKRCRGQGVDMAGGRLGPSSQRQRGAARRRAWSPHPPKSKEGTVQQKRPTSATEDQGKKKPVLNSIKADAPSGARPNPTHPSAGWDRHARCSRHQGKRRHTEGAQGLDRGVRRRRRTT